MSYTSIHFPGSARYLQEVRRWTAKIVGDVSGAEDVVQIACELAANAIQHTASGEDDGKFTLHIATFTDRWQVRVDDMGGATEPRICASTDADEAGRGLVVVTALASSWGVVGDEYARAVWAEVPMPHEPFGS